MEFEWDENKRDANLRDANLRDANLRKHRLDLIDGSALLDGRPVYTYPSPRASEQRSVTIGTWRTNSSPLCGPSARARSDSSPYGGPEMRKRERIVRYTAEEVAAKIAAGESRTDWRRVKAMPQEEIERLAGDEDGPLPEGWEATVIIGLPPRKEGIHIRLDADTLDWFRAHGKGYQSRINAVLRAFVEARRQSAPDRGSPPSLAVTPARNPRPRF